MQFSPDLRDRVANGTVTVSYRLWSRPKVKIGGTLVFRVEFHVVSSGASR